MTSGAAVIEDRQAKAGRSLHRARLLLAGAGLELRPGVDEDQVEAMLARVLRRSHPFATPHGRLIVAAMQARGEAERRAGPRPPAEGIIRHLLAAGQAPTPRAVAVELEHVEARDRAQQAQRERVAPLIERDGPCVAEIVAGQWRRQGIGPTPTEVARALGWPNADTKAILAAMAEAGWITRTGPDARSLRPGPKAPHLAISR